MAGWHHWLDGCESEWTLGVGDGPVGPACGNSWGHRVEHDWVIELNWTKTVSNLRDKWIKTHIWIDLFLSCFFCLFVFNLSSDLGMVWISAKKWHITKKKKKTKKLLQKFGFYYNIWTSFEEDVFKQLKDSVSIKSKLSTTNTQQAISCKFCIETVPYSALQLGTENVRNVNSFFSFVFSSFHFFHLCLTSNSILLWVTHSLENFWTNECATWWWKVFISHLQRTGTFLDPLRKMQCLWYFRLHYQVFNSFFSIRIKVKYYSLLLFNLSFSWSV